VDDVAVGIVVARAGVERRSGGHIHDSLVGSICETGTRSRGLRRIHLGWLRNRSLLHGMRWRWFRDRGLLLTGDDGFVWRGIGGALVLGRLSGVLSYEGSGCQREEGACEDWPIHSKSPSFEIAGGVPLVLLRPGLRENVPLRERLTGYSRRGCRFHASLAVSGSVKPGPEACLREHESREVPPVATFDGLRV
jgi:hypothetical protein